MKRIVLALIASTFVITTAQANISPVLVNQCNGGDGHSCWRLATAQRNAGDEKQAVKTFSKSCDLGFAQSCNDAGFAYEYGQLGQKQNYKKALQLFQKGCDLGNNGACMEIEQIKSDMK